MSKIEKTEQEWREQLTEMEYHVCREKGTERPFTGQYWDCDKSGAYLCTGCQQPLFESKTKFDAGCGWPSFSAPAMGGAVDENSDLSHGMIRTEVVCKHCASHLGHVFNDGPKPTGKRYCINSASIKLEEED